jgi:DNA-binding CsgD family transcriptional regulator
MTPPNKISPEKMARAIELLRTGASFQVVSAEIGVTINGLQKRIRSEGGREALGIPAPTSWRAGKHNMTPAELAKALLAGASSILLAKRLGLSEGGMNDRVRQLRQGGCIPRDAKLFHGSLTTDGRHDERISGMFSAGKSPDEIGETLIIPVEFVRRRLMRLGMIEAPPKPPRKQAQEQIRENKPIGQILSDDVIAVLYRGQRYDRRVM